MSERPANVRSELKIRLSEKLRLRLEVEADRVGLSLNAVAVNALENAFHDADLGLTIFGSEENYSIWDACHRLALAVQLRAGKDWTDAATCHQIADAVRAYLAHGAEIFATIKAGRSPAAARTVADAWALQLVAQIINQDVERYTAAAAEKAAAEDAPQGEAEAGEAGEAA